MYVMYVYDCNAILEAVMKNRSDKEMIRVFTELITDLKSRGISPEFHFTDNEGPTALRMEITTMDINYQLVPPSNHRANNSERENKTFKNHFIVGLFSVYENFYLQL